MQKYASRSVGRIWQVSSKNCMKMETREEMGKKKKFTKKKEAKDKNSLKISLSFI